MKLTKKIVFDTPITDKYANNKLLGYARIEGVGYSDQNYAKDWKNGECEPEDIFSFDINTVYFLVDGKTTTETQAYRISKQLGGEISDIIDAAALAHVQYVFSETYELDCAMIPETDHTDTEQGEFPAQVVYVPELGQYKQIA